MPRTFKGFHGCYGFGSISIGIYTLCGNVVWEIEFGKLHLEQWDRELGAGVGPLGLLFDISGKQAFTEASEERNTGRWKETGSAKGSCSYMIGRQHDWYIRCERHRYRRYF